MAERENHHVRISHKAREVSAERFTYPPKQNVLRFFKQIEAFPDSLALGIHGTERRILPHIRRGGLYSASDYFRLDPKLDWVLQRDLDREDHQALFRQLANTLSFTAIYGTNLQNKQAGIVVFIAPPRDHIATYNPELFPNPAPYDFPAADNDGGATANDIVLIIQQRRGESSHSFGQRAAHRLMKLRISSEQAGLHWIGRRLMFKDKQKKKETK